MSTIWCLFNTQRRSNGLRSFSTLLHSCIELGKIIDFTRLPDDLCVLELSMTMTTTLLLKTALSGTETTSIQHRTLLLSCVPLFWLEPSLKQILCRILVPLTEIKSLGFSDLATSAVGLEFYIVYSLIVKIQLFMLSIDFIHDGFQHCVFSVSCRDMLCLMTEWTVIGPLSFIHEALSCIMYPGVFGLVLIGGSYTC